MYGQCSVTPDVLYRPVLRTTTAISSQKKQMAGQPAVDSASAKKLTAHYTRSYPARKLEFDGSQFTSNSKVSVAAHNRMVTTPPKTLI